MAQLIDELKSELFKTIYYNLGGDMVDVELDPGHYEYGLKQAFQVYRQRSSNATEESYMFLPLVPDQNEYVLPNEVINVQSVFRRTIGSGANSNSSAGNFEPFEAGYMNQYMLQSGQLGGLFSYELFAQYQELSARMFGGYINFHFNTATKKLAIMHRPRSGSETVMLWARNYKPDVVLLQDTYAAPWIKDYTQAKVKMSLGEAREKFATVTGPGGGTVLNGGSLKAEAGAEMEKLMLDLNNYVEGGTPMWFIIG